MRRSLSPGRVLPAVCAVAALGLILRIVYLLVFVEDSSLVGDGLEYHGLANGLADGRGFVNPFAEPGQTAEPTAHKPPLYPLLLAVTSVVGATGHAPHQIVSAVAGTGTVLVCALLAHRLAGPRAALIAACIGAAYPVFLVADASLRAESLYAFLVALALLAAYRAWEEPGLWRLAQLGAVIGLASLTRSEGIVLLLLLALPVAWRPGRPGRAKRVGAAAAACAIVLAPWLIRCWIAFDEPVAISTSSGDLLAGANCDATYSGANIGGWSFECVLGETGATEAVVAQRLRDRGLRYARDHTERLPAVVAARALRPWGLFDPDGEVRGKTLGEGRSEAANWAGLAACWALIVLAAIRLRGPQAPRRAAVHPRRAVPARPARERHRVRDPQVPGAGRRGARGAGRGGAGQPAGGPQRPARIRTAAYRA